MPQDDQATHLEVSAEHESFSKVSLQNESTGLKEI